MSAGATASLTGTPGFLLETSVISALTPGREAHLPSSFVDWLHLNNTRLHTVYRGRGAVRALFRLYASGLDLVAPGNQLLAHVNLEFSRRAGRDIRSHGCELVSNFLARQDAVY